MRLSQIANYETIVENVDYTGIPEEHARRLQEYKPHYQEWGVRALRSGKHIESVVDCITHYIDNIGDNRFQMMLKNVTTAPKNILTIPYDILKNIQNEYDEKYHSMSKREATKLRKKKDLAGFNTEYTEIIVDKLDLKIVKFFVPERRMLGPTEEDLKNAVQIVTEMAKGTKWCVKGPKLAEDYLKRGPLYLIIINGEKLLCHLETEQLKDINDEDYVLFDDEEFEKLSKYIPNMTIFNIKNMYASEINNKDLLVMRIELNRVECQRCGNESVWDKDEVLVYPEDCPDCGEPAKYWSILPSITRKSRLRYNNETAENLLRKAGTLYYVIVNGRTLLIKPPVTHPSIVYSSPRLMRQRTIHGYTTPGFILDDAGQNTQITQEEYNILSRGPVSKPRRSGFESATEYDTRRREEKVERIASIFRDELKDFITK